MKFLRQGIALAFVGAGLAAIPAMQVQAQAAEPSLVQQMKAEADGAVRFDDVEHPVFVVAAHPEHLVAEQDEVVIGSG